MPPQKWTTLRSWSLFLAKTPQHKNSRWESLTGHRQTSQVVHPRGYEAQESLIPNPTSTASPKTVCVKPESPAGRAEGWSPENTGPEKGALHSHLCSSIKQARCLITSSPEATQMTKCQCVQLLNRLPLQHSPRQHAPPISVWTLAQECQMQPLGLSA